MAIPFSDIPADIRAPVVATEVDSTRAVRGRIRKPYKVLVFGQRLSSGTVAQKVPKQVLSADQARTFFGNGSMLHNIALAMFKQRNRVTDVTFIALDDVVGGTAATLTVTVSASTAKSGTISLQLGGRSIPVAVAEGQTADQIAANIRTAVNLENTERGLGVVASGATNAVILTAVHKGAEGNSIDVRVNYYDGERLPDGVSLANVPGTLASGATNPTIDGTLLSPLGDEQYDILILPWNDATNHAVVDLEFADRWGPLRQVEGAVRCAKRDTHANLVTLGTGRNTKFISTAGFRRPLEPTWELAAAYGTACAFEGRQDPARPLQTVELVGIKPQAKEDAFTWEERDLLYRYGIAATTNEGGAVRIDRAVTHYRTSPAGAPDPSFGDSETLQTLATLRYELRNRIKLRYPRHKAADDGTAFSAGQVVLTPGILKGEILALYREWEADGLVEDYATFKRDLLVERNASDPSRFDVRAPANLVNGARVFAVQFQFVL
jgi:phage tail sheath gpL-like